MSSMAMTQPAAGRPQSLVGAVALTLLLTVVGNVVVFFWADTEGASAVGAAIGAVSIALHLVAVWGLWNLRRWGWIMTLIVTGLDLVSGLPFLGDERGWFVAATLGFLLAEVVIFALLLVPSTRSAIRRA